MKKNKSKKGSSFFRFIAISLAAAAGTGALVFYLATTLYMRHFFDVQRERASLLELAETLESEKSPAYTYLSAFDSEMRQINPDYLCWIQIENTTIDYPVVRGNDNEQYLNRSFYGERNRYGAVFMDYRCIGDYVPHIIIYGHNSRRGDMFSDLHNFLDERYLAEHPIITLKVNDRIVEYEIYSARKTDINDPAYFLDFSTPGSFRAFAERCGAPLDAAQIITLSTCVSGNNRNERIIVQGALR